MEETVVRDKAVESACVVIGLMQGGHQEVRGFANECALFEMIGGACDFFVWIAVYSRRHV